MQHLVQKLIYDRFPKKTPTTSFRFPLFVISILKILNRLSICSTLVHSLIYPCTHSLQDDSLSCSEWIIKYIMLFKSEDRIHSLRIQNFIWNLWSIWVHMIISFMEIMLMSQLLCNMLFYLAKTTTIKHFLFPTCTSFFLSSREQFKPPSRFHRNSYVYFKSQV